MAIEVLDNLPVHVIESLAGAVREIHVDGGLTDEDVKETRDDLSTPELESFGPHLADGEPWDVGLDAVSMAMMARLVGRGVACFIDYGYEGPGRQTLVSYSGTGPSSDLLAAPGSATSPRTSTGTR